MVVKSTVEEIVQKYYFAVWDTRRISDRSIPEDQADKDANYPHRYSSK